MARLPPWRTAHRAATGSRRPARSWRVRLRGAWTGNRGILHEGEDVVRFHRGNLWIICALEFRGWRLPQWAPGHLTVLFFHDEAVALAAGHRPCALCRRAAYERYRQAWVSGNSGAVPTAAVMNAALHRQRLVAGTHRRRLHTIQWQDVPSGAFVLADARPFLALDDAVVPWTPRGYDQPRGRPRAGRIQVITPPATLGALRAGYLPQLDASAGGRIWRD